MKCKQLELKKVKMKSKFSGDNYCPQNTVSHQQCDAFTSVFINGNGKYQFDCIRKQVLGALEKFGFQPRNDIRVAEDGSIPDGPLEGGGYQYQSHLPVLPGDVGELGFPLAYLSDGTLVEYYGWEYPMIVRRGDLAIKEKRQHYSEIVGNVKSIAACGDECNCPKCSVKQSKQAPVSRDQFMMASLDQDGQQLINLGVLMALDWVLGEREVNL